MDTTAISAEQLLCAQGAGNDYLVCIEGERSWTVRLPDSGDLIIGRDPQSGLVLADALVSRAHAQLLLVGDELRLVDRDSRHGTTVNGERLSAPRRLRSGDVIGIGETVIVVRRAARLEPAQQLAERDELMRRLGEEAERALRDPRELVVAVLRRCGRGRIDAPAVMAALLHRLRSIDLVAPLGDGAFAVVMPELGGDEAQAMIAAALGAEPWLAELAVGLAVAPFDGVDGDTLLSGAWAAAEQAAAGRARWARDAVQEVTAGGHRIQIADPAMVRIYELGRRLARSTLPVLVLGETGTGKELAAAMVHGFSPRAAGPFISVNCAAILESLAESELFGHARGAFTGAVTARAGHFEAAHGGTLFLDEIGELPLSIQAKLLRALETGEVQRVGEVAPRQIDLRIVAATNRDLEAEVEAGRFRRDLFFRLGAARLILPPLRDRPRDLACLAARFLDEQCREQRRPALSWSVAAAQALFAHRWPGNVRELFNAVQLALHLAPDDAIEIEVWHLPPHVTQARSADGRARALAGAADGGEAQATAEGGAAFRPISDEVRELERRRMVEALRASGGVQNRAAELIAMPLRTFATKLRRYRIAAADWSG
jgi:DNA-binding NtrC family response regulator/pSer/pThr/pTyr-binding forkhead associated (FHA) protein